MNLTQLHVPRDESDRGWSSFSITTRLCVGVCVCARVVNHFDRARLQLRFKPCQKGARTSHREKKTYSYFSLRTHRELSERRFASTSSEGSGVRREQNRLNTINLLRRIVSTKKKTNKQKKTPLWWSSSVWDVNRTSLYEILLIYESFPWASLLVFLWKQHSSHRASGANQAFLGSEKTTLFGSVCYVLSHWAFSKLNRVAFCDVHLEI